MEPSRYVHIHQALPSEVAKVISHSLNENIISSMMAVKLLGSYLIATYDGCEANIPIQT